MTMAEGESKKEKSEMREKRKRDALPNAAIASESDEPPLKVRFFTFWAKIGQIQIRNWYWT